MVLSVHLADLGWRAVPGVLRRKPRPSEVPGLRYAETTGAATLGGSLLPTPQPGRAALIAAWDDDDALDEFSASHPLAQRLARGWHVRLQPLHVYGSWPELPGLPEREIAVDEEEPVAVLTLGQLRLRRLRPFLRASAAAEAEATGDPGMLAASGLARPPRRVATFSIWRNVAAMREYARGRSGGAHPAATSAHRANSFHHESAFIRFRPYATQGLWDGRDPLANPIPTLA
jgi:heme-degrading monooxygenase HmoA